MAGLGWRWTLLVLGSICAVEGEPGGEWGGRGSEASGEGGRGRSALEPLRTGLWRGGEEEARAGGSFGAREGGSV